MKPVYCVRHSPNTYIVECAQILLLLHSTLYRTIRTMREVTLESRMPLKIAAAAHFRCLRLPLCVYMRVFTYDDLLKH